MHRLLFALAALGLASCGAKAPENYTTTSTDVLAAKKAYDECALNTGALLANNRTEPLETLVSLVIRTCEPKLLELRIAIMEENLGYSDPNAFANTYGDNYRASTRALVADALVVVRSVNPR
ncbi:hypothetical protein [Aquabacterium parvum]|jgi:hypothetical protein|uniref:hypothetical protein n=1 Tax=Aquabacterium parvum TaxID=70584 RepID=UPI000718E5E1|nr:hypothetical protein [Aquabacterium parvum]